MFSTSGPPKRSMAAASMVCGICTVCFASSRISASRRCSIVCLRLYLGMSQRLYLGMSQRLAAKPRIGTDRAQGQVFRALLDFDLVDADRVAAVSPQDVL